MLKRYIKRLQNINIKSICNVECMQTLINKAVNLILMPAITEKWRVVTNFKSVKRVITITINGIPNANNSLLQFEERMSSKHWFNYDLTSRNNTIGDILKVFQQNEVAFCKFR